MLWLQFFISAAVIVVAGIKLTTYADILGDRLKLGKVWLGVVLLGLITSLPEAMTSLTAVISFQAADLAVSNMVGSNNFNIFLLVLMDLVYRQGSVTNKIPYRRSHLMPGVFAFLMTGIVIIDIGWSSRISIPAMSFLSVGSLFLFMIYFFGMRTLSGGAGGVVNEPEHPAPQDSFGKIGFNLLISAVLVIGSAVWLTSVAERIAEVTGLGQTFVGAIFLAMVTSLPEMVVTISAIRIGALDLAVGNIFGSNMTNLFLIGVCDIFYLRGPILASVSKTHIIVAVFGLILTCVAWLGIRDKNKKVFFGLGWDSWLLAFVFTAGLGVLYYLK